MTEEQDPSSEYLKGFNHGYMLSKSDPELLQHLLKAEKGDSEYIKAVEAGKRQQELEKLREQLHENSKQREKGRER